jgi:hypothetical protein
MEIQPGESTGIGGDHKPVLKKLELILSAAIIRFAEILKKQPIGGIVHRFAQQGEQAFM